MGDEVQNPLGATTAHPCSRAGDAVDTTLQKHERSVLSHVVLPTDTVSWIV